MQKGTLALLAIALLASPLSAQSFDGILVVGKARVAAQKARVALISNRNAVIDTGVTDVFGGFNLKAEKAGKYTILVRRTGYLPIQTENFELVEGDVLRDTVFLEGTVAEKSTKDVISASVRQVFGSSLLTAFWRYAGPDDIEPVRDRFFSLGDYSRGGGKLLGLQHVSPPSGCFRFSGQRRCAQIFLNGIAVNLSPDQISMSEVEAVVAIHPSELGSAITGTRIADNSRYGAVLVYTTGFMVR
ncbi:MAG: hypothetical protein ACT4OZ_12150 [Gemmatimonadota bacterium]